MPDITMCVAEDCPLKMKCYRYQATPKEYHQSVARFQPKEDGTCEHFVTTDGWDWRGLRMSEEPAFKVPAKKD